MRAREPLVLRERIFEIDVVRGFALFGVLLVNMYGFGADSITWTSVADRTASLPSSSGASSAPGWCFCPSNHRPDRPVALRAAVSGPSGVSILRCKT